MIIFNHLLICSWDNSNEGGENKANLSKYLYITNVDENYYPKVVHILSSNYSINDHIKKLKLKLYKINAYYYDNCTDYTQIIAYL